VLQHAGSVRVELRNRAAGARGARLMATILSPEALGALKCKGSATNQI
jgi:hypothetical protein